MLFAGINAKTQIACRKDVLSGYSHLLLLLDVMGRRQDCVNFSGEIESGDLSMTQEILC